ncbi:MAG: hypothetical protein KDA72_15275, partial [Planctomycetales bacterium]|nr:hypothetical protein [Planctomycetales bacterium]
MLGLQRPISPLSTGFPRVQTADLTAILATLQSRKDLSREQMRQFVAWLLSGTADLPTITACLLTLSDKGET